jgi:NTP pyrophosphatase (non-canonical NTP hydrolase)
MDIQKLMNTAVEIKEKYHELEDKTIGKRWTNAQIMEGFVGDVGDLMRIIMAKEGLRDDIENIDEKLAHELADCLYCVLVLAKKYNVDIEKSFLNNMDKLDKRLAEGKG